MATKKSAKPKGDQSKGSKKSATKTGSPRSPILSRYGLPDRTVSNIEAHRHKNGGWYLKLTFEGGELPQMLDLDGAARMAAELRAAGEASFASGFESAVKTAKALEAGKS